MKSILRLVLMGVSIFTLTGLSYTLSFNRTIMFTGNINLASEALGRAIIKNGGESYGGDVDKNSLYVIDRLSIALISKADIDQIEIKGSLLMGNGCANRENTISRIDMLLLKILKQANEESGISMKINNGPKGA